MGWEDDDDEQDGGSIAEAFLGSKEGDTPDSVPDPVEGGQQDADPEPTDPDYEAGQNAEQAYKIQSGSATQGSDDSGPVDQDVAEDGEGAGYAAQSSGDEDSGGGSGSAPAAGGNSQAPGAMGVPVPPQYQNLDYQQLERDLQSFRPGDYKPSVGRRIASGLAGALTAFGGRDPSRVIDQISNAPLRTAQAAQNQRIEADKQAIIGAQAQNQQSQRTYQDQRQNVNDQALNQQRLEHAADYQAHATSRDAQLIPTTMKPVDPKNPLGAWQGQTVAGKVINNLAPPDSYLKTPAAKQALIEQNIAAARSGGHPYTPEQEAVVRSGGHVTIPNRTNIRIPSEGESEYQDFKSTFQKQNGRPPGPADIEQFRNRSQAGSNADPETGAIVADATQRKQDFADKYTRDPSDGSYSDNNGNSISGQEFNAKIDGFRTAANQKLAKYGAQIDAQGNVQTRANPAQGNGQPQPAQPQAPQTAKLSSGATVKMGDPIVDPKGRKGTVAGFNAQGKIIPKWN